MAVRLRRRRFNAQFKLDAVRLVQSSDQLNSAIARKLSIRRELLTEWKRELEADPQNTFPGKAHLQPEQGQSRLLQQELKQMTGGEDHF
jgi:transposase